MTEEQLPEDAEINLLDFLIILLRHKKLVIYITLGTAVIAAIISLVMTPIYEAKSTILPPRQSSPGISQLLSSSALAIMGGGLPGIKNSGELYISLLKSRSVLDNVIARLNLLKYYEVRSRYAARRRLRGALKTKNNLKSGIITIGVDDKNPKESAAMANTFVEALNDINGGLAITKASQKRLFFQNQLAAAKAALANAEAAMTAFQQKTGLVQADAQGEAVIKAIADIGAQIAAKEVQIRVMKTYSASANPELETANEELSGLRAQAAKLEVAGGTGDSGPLIPTRKIPSVEADYENKLMTLKFDEKLYGLLQNQYESAKLGEAGDPSIIQVIDKAVPPNQRVSPQRKRIVLVSMLIAFLFSTSVAFLIDYKEKFAADPENKQRFEAIKKYASVEIIKTWKLKK